MGYGVIWGVGFIVRWLRLVVCGGCGFGFVWVGGGWVLLWGVWVCGGVVVWVCCLVGCGGGWDDGGVDLGWRGGDWVGGKMCVGWL